MAANSSLPDLIYKGAQKVFALAPLAVFGGTFFINLPFGRFALKSKTLLEIDGVKAWMIMEIPVIISFIYSYITAPFSGVTPSLSLKNPQTLLASLFLIHYANRAVISPLRTPGRSKSHAIIVCSAVLFNITNGFLIGSYLSSPQASDYLTNAYTRPAFWLYASMWLFGFVGNIIHDEILFDIRRKKEKSSRDGNAIPRYAIPYGYLYNYISYPNYLCEWVEWAGFALASAPIPSLLNYTNAPPPWLFLSAELLVMFPRAYNGHQWYLNKFEDYPKERRAIIPFVI